MQEGLSHVLVWLCRKAYLTSWFLIDIIACLPLECILANAATHVNFYNTPKLIRQAAHLMLA